MTQTSAKVLILPILHRWAREVIWSVIWPIDEAIAECRWFKSEKRAKEFAAVMAGARVERTVFDTHESKPIAVEEFLA